MADGRRNEARNKKSGAGLVFGTGRGLDVGPCPGCTTGVTIGGGTGAEASGFPAPGFYHQEEEETTHGGI